MSYFDLDLFNFLVHEKNCDERIVQEMCRINRSHFLPLESHPLIGTYKPVPIGYKQTMSAPFIVASMTALLELSGGEKVLEIGSGCGYQTAVLLAMNADVYAVEYIPELAAFGKSNLNKLGLNANIVCGDGYFGRPEAAPFDCILIAATVPKVPERLLEQLKTGGKMVFPLKKNEKEYMVRLHKQGPASYSLEWLYGVIFVPFVGAIRNGI